MQNPSVETADSAVFSPGEAAPGWETVAYRAPLAMRFFYHTLLGRILFRPILAQPFSAVAGRFLDSGLSRSLIASFIRRNGIDPTEFEERKYRSFNDFFTRRIKDGNRAFSAAEEDFCSPCDAALSVYPLTPDATFCVKESTYTLAEILDDEALAADYSGGAALVFRLGVQDYHRYAFPDDCRVGERKTLPGMYHTVQPIAVNTRPVFHRNNRVWTKLQTAHFGDLIYMEVGALLVGRICNRTDVTDAKRGEEKGYFAYGGSTVILFLKPHTVRLSPVFRENTAEGLETKVRQGQVLGVVGEESL